MTMIALTREQQIRINPHLAENLSKEYPAFRYRAAEGTDLESEQLAGYVAKKFMTLEDEEGEIESSTATREKAGLKPHEWFNSPLLKPDAPTVAVADDSELADALASLKQAYSAAVAQNEALKAENAKLNTDIKFLEEQLDAAESKAPETETKKKAK